MVTPPRLLMREDDRPERAGSIVEAASGAGARYGHRPPGSAPRPERRGGAGGSVGPSRLRPPAPGLDRCGAKGIDAAPKGSTQRQRARRSRRATATIAMRRAGPRIVPARAANHRLMAEPGWWRSRSRDIWIVVRRSLAFPALPIPCPCSRPPPCQGVGASPASAASCRRSANGRHKASGRTTQASSVPMPFGWAGRAGPCRRASSARRRDRRVALGLHRRQVIKDDLQATGLAAKLRLRPGWQRPAIAGDRIVQAGAIGSVERSEAQDALAGQQPLDPIGWRMRSHKRRHGSRCHGRRAGGATRSRRARPPAR